MCENRGKEVALLRVEPNGIARVDVSVTAIHRLAPGTYRLYTAGCKGCGKRAAENEKVQMAMRRLRSFLYHRDDADIQCAEHRDGPDTCDCGAADAFKALTAVVAERGAN